MAIIIPQITADQGGQAAITFYGFGKSKLQVLKEQAVESARQGAPLVQAVLTPVFPAIVQPPLVPLPVKLTAGLPSMTPDTQNPPGTGMSCEMKAKAEELARGSWSCRLGRWVDENMGAAIGVVVLAYVVSHGKSKR